MKRKPITIIDAIRNPKLFGSLPAFKKLDTWAAWLVALKAIFGLPMRADELAIYHRHTGRALPAKDGVKECYLIIGRRGGKSFISALITVFIACFENFQPFITVGESLVILCLAKDREQARIVFRYVKAILNHIPALKAMIITERADEVELSTGVTIMVKASDFGGVRGPTIAAAVLDELAFWPSEGANPDNEVVAALRPAMVTIPSAKLLCISTGYAQAGTLYDAHRRYFGKDNEDGVLVWQSDSHSMNPSISAEFIQAEIEKDPDAARSEWLGMFREDVTAAFPLELIEGCIVPGRVELPYIPGVRYQSFDDVSGGRSDSWAKAVAHIERGVIVIDCLAYWGPPFDPGLIAQESAAIGKRYHCSQTIGDRYAGEWPIAEFQKHAIRYITAEKSKSELYLDLIPQMSGRKVELPDDKRLLQELRRLERRRGRSGKDIIDHGPNGHDDTANVIAGVVSLIASRPQVNPRAQPIGVGKNPFFDAARSRAMLQPLPGGSTFGPPLADTRGGCAELYGVSWGDNSEEEGGYVSQTGRRKKFPSMD